MSDVKLLRSQRLTDNPDGGGLATATEIVDGQINNLFDDVSRIDRVNGDLSLRKVFPQATTADTGLFSGLHCIVQSPPSDPRVSAVIFETGVWSDERDDAKNQVERYLDESVITRMIPYDRQLAGQRTILVYTRPELSLPEIGEVYAIKNETAGTIEYFRIQDIDHAVETFTDTQGDFKARVLTLTISQPLSREFVGSQPNRYFTVEGNKSVVRKTIASDAARYKGVTNLALDATAGDLTIKVDSVYSQLVPAANSEVGVTDATPAGVEVMVQSGTDDIVETFQFNLFELRKYTKAAIAPGTLTMIHAPSSVHLYDDGSGEMVDFNTEEKTGVTIDYAAGTITFTAPAILAYGINQLTTTYKPGTEISKSALSTATVVDISNRGYVYNKTLRPIPEPGSTTVSFRALGKWYELQDDGTGALVGESGVGTGLVNFATGTVSVSLGALPDIDSSVIFAWGAASEYEIRDTDVDVLVPSVEFTLETGNCEPSTLEITWLAGATTKTATDNGTGGITGDAAGTIIYGTGQVVFRPTVLPNSSTLYSCEYEGAASTTEVFTPTAAGGFVTITAASAPITSKSIKVSVVGQALYGTVSVAFQKDFIDNGAGQLMDQAGNINTGSSVNYTTGVIVFAPDFAVQKSNLVRSSYSATLPARTVSATTGYYSPAARGGKWPAASGTTAATATFQDGSAVTLTYKQASATDVAQTDSFPVQPLKIDMTPLVKSAIVPGGLNFTLGGREYYDRQGVLYYGISSTTGAGTSAGTVNYTTGVVTLTSWVGNVSPAFDVKALLTEVKPLPLSYLHGRTPGSPLRPSTFYVQANRYRDGALISATADNNGNISTSSMHGYVDVNTGVFSIAFGQYVLDTSLTADEKLEDWYDAADIDADGYVFNPDEIIPGTLRFNCVVLVSLPQDPEIIGVNPVRLPTDGRVQSIRPGDTLVIHDTQPFTMSSPLAADDTENVGRTDLASVALYDQDGLGVDPALYTVDLATGIITMENPLDLSAYNEPLIALHTIEDMALCLDAEITGQVKLGQALTRDYTAANSMCSAALVIGDVQARYESLFPQATWTNVWSNDLIGSAPASGANYNDVTYPIQVLNRDAITQRWALIFTSSTAFNIVSEELGVIGTGSTAAGASPNNPATSNPYFTILAAGFGTGWGTGNVIRFNTVAAGGPVWVARTVRSGPATELDDQIRLQVRWDKD